MSQFTLLTVIVMLFFVSFGRALLDCRDPPADNEAFFDLDELRSLAVTYPDVFKTPAKCSAETASDCAKQICCKDEIGCCYKDPESKRQMCGCKAKTDKECTRGPPLVYLRTYRCEDHHSAETQTCIRKTKDGEIVDGSVATWIGLVPRNDIDDTLKATGDTAGEIIDNVEKTTSDVLEGNAASAGRLLDSLTVKTVLDMMSSEKLYIIAQEVMGRHLEGLPYGRQQTH